MKQLLEVKLAELKSGLESLGKRRDELTVGIFRQEGAIWALEQLIDDIADIADIADIDEDTVELKGEETNA